MKNKKRIFAAFAAAAVAVSMLTFTGCEGSKPDGDGTDKTPAGVIEGDYKEKNDEEVKDIVDNIKPGDLFGDLDAADASLGVHITEKMEASVVMGAYMGVNSTVDLDYKMYADATDYVAGMGTVAVKADYMMMSETGAPQIEKIDVSASLYNDMQYAYGTVTGLGDKAMTGKLDIEKLMASFGGADGFSLLANSEITGSSEFNILDMLAMAKQFDIAVSFDTADGVKVKLSASEETVWKVLAASEVEEEMITVIKQAVTFNKFQYDVYFSIAADGKFDRASEVMDIDLSFDVSALIGTEAGTEADDEAPAMPPITAHVKGSTEISTFSEKLTIPDSVKAYSDMTDTVIELIQSMMPDGPEDGDGSVDSGKVA